MIQLLEHDNLSFIQNNFDKIDNDLRRELDKMDECFYPIKRLFQSDLNYC